MILTEQPTRCSDDHGQFFPYESGMKLSRDIDALQKSMRDTRNNVEARGVQLEEQSEKLESQIRQPTISW